MSEFNYIRNLLELKEVNIYDIKSFEKENYIFFDLPVKEHKCPYCFSMTSTIHDYRLQFIKDIPIYSKPTFLVYKKRRYACKCCKKRFYEDNNIVGKYQQKSNRLNLTVINELMSEYSMSSIAKRYNISVSTVSRILDYLPNNYLNKLPNVISIDEFKGNTNFGKYQCIITNPVDKKILDILPVRNELRLKEYFRSFSLDDRKNVSYAVIDMWRPYASVIKHLFPNAKLVIDRFHYVRQVTWAFENVRKRIQKSLCKHDRLYYKNSKKLLLKNSSYISDDEYFRLRIIFRKTPLLEYAYDLKEGFYWVLQSSDSIEANYRLNLWLNDVKDYNIPEFIYASKSISNWKDYILNSFDVNYTNAFTEGKNNKIKVIKRNAYGLRNFFRFKKRILLNNLNINKGLHFVVKPSLYISTL